MNREATTKVADKMPNQGPISPPGARRGRRWVALVATFVALATTAIGLGSTPVGAQEGITGDTAQQLVDKYSPIIMIKAQEEACTETGERYLPTSVDVVLDNPQVVLRQIGTDNPVMMESPGASDIIDLGAGFFLDFPGSALSPDCIYEKDFQRYSAAQAPAVYGHIVLQDDKPNQLVIQYWIFWYFNDWNNKHEGDWEGIQLLFDVGTVDEALQRNPVSAGYAQHDGGQESDWDGGIFEHRGTHPVVYPSVGSHASYFDSALHLGRSAGEGFGCDTSANAMKELDVEVLLLPDTVTDPDDPHAWIMFEGHWGERHGGPFDGPTGPRQKPRWTEPVTWHEGLRSTSVVVPGAGESVAGLINSFCGVVKAGSTAMISLQQDPTTLLLGGGLVLVLASFLLHRTDWTSVRPLPIVRRRRAGQIAKASVRLYRAKWPAFLAAGLLYIPASLVVGLGVGLLKLLPIIGPLLKSDEDVGLIGMLVSTAVASAGHAAAFTVVCAAVAVLMAALQAEEELSASEVRRQVAGQFGNLVAGTVRAGIVVGLLVLTVVGIPWAIRQLIRYQYLAPATMLEGLNGRDALDRSSQLVRHRWYHTAVSVVFLNLLVGAVALVVGLLLLMGLQGLPLWLFSALITASGVVTVPYVAIAVTLLYGDAIAGEDDGEWTGLVEPASEELTASVHPG